MFQNDPEWEENFPIKRGNKVIFHLDYVCNESISYGGHDDPRGILEDKQEYTVYDLEIYSWYTHIILDKIDGKFNSVWFRVIGE